MALAAVDRDDRLDEYLPSVFAMTAASDRADDRVAAPVKKPRRSAAKRIGLAALGALLLIVAAAVVAEIAGWPFLAGPMQSALSKVLDRPVYLEGALTTDSSPSTPSAAAASGAASAARTRTAGGVRLKLFGRIELRAQRIEIAAPEWSKGPPMLVAENARLQLRYGDLWRASRGGALRIRSVEADRMDVQLERLADGRASWVFGKPKDPAEASKPVAIPVFEDMRVADGRLALRDAVLDSELNAKFSLVDGTGIAGTGTGTGTGPGTAASGAVARSQPMPAAEAASGARLADAGKKTGLNAEATGRYRKLPVKISLHTVGVLPWVADSAVAVGVPLEVAGQVGGARLRFDGRVRDVQNLAGLGGRFSLSGPSLAAVGDVLGVTLPTTAAFTTKGLLVKNGEVWSTRIDQALIGKSSLKAALRYDPTQPTPLLAGKITGPRLLLADLGPAIGTGPAPAAIEGAKPAAAAAKAGRVLPDREFDLPSLRAMDANILFDLQELDLGTERLRPLQPMRAHLVLNAGVLELRDIDARTADGQLRGTVSLDGRESLAIWRTDLRWSQVKLEQWLQQERADDAPPYITGRLDGLAKLEGRGRSTAQILASLHGDLRGRLRDGTISHLVVEAAGIDLAQAIGVFIKGDNALPLDCALADLKVDKGVATPKVMVVDARDSVVWVEGSVSLAQETLDLRAMVAPRDFSPLALRTPVKVRGSLSDPQVSLEAGPLVRKLGLSAVLALINPLAAVLPLLDFGSDDEKAGPAGGCRALAAQAAAPRSGTAKTTGKAKS